MLTSQWKLVPFLRSSFARNARAARENDDGSVAILFCFVTFAALISAGIAIDFARTARIQSRLSQAADAAVLAAGRALLSGNTAVQDLEDVARNYFAENTRNLGSGIGIGSPKVTIVPTSGAVALAATARVNLRLVRLAGFSTLDVPISSASVFRQRDVEVGIALDITGSMAQHIGGQQKIESMKAAVGAFVNSMLPLQGTRLQRVRIGIAPYAASVNLGAYVDAAADGRSSDGCVVERMGAAATDEFGPYHVVPNGRSFGYACPGASILPLSLNHDALHQKIAALQPSGSTAGHLGIQWAWNIVSEHWAAAWGSDAAPDPLSRVAKGELLKAVILMTDGEFNTQYHGRSSSVQALAMCDAIKAQGIAVFTVGFGLGANPAATNMLRSCASSGEGYFANANTADDLDLAFANFAGKLSELRLVW